jgi:hypothetical protein
MMIDSFYSRLKPMPRSAEFLPAPTWIIAASPSPRQSIGMATRPSGLRI